MWKHCKFHTFNANVLLFWHFVNAIKDFILSAPFYKEIEKQLATEIKGFDKERNCHYKKYRQDERI